MPKFAKGGHIFVDSRRRQETSPVDRRGRHNKPSSLPQISASPKKLKDPLLEIFNIVPDKVARGIAKKATVFGKRNKLDYSAMGDEVEKRITAAGKSSDEMTNAINNLKAYVVKQFVQRLKIE